MHQNSTPEKGTGLPIRPTAPNWYRYLAASLLILLFAGSTLSAHAQRKNASLLPFHDVLEKYTFSPASNDQPDNADGSRNIAGNPTDGALYLYFKPAYADKVEEVSFHVPNQWQRPDLNPIRRVRSSAKPFVIPNLKYNGYSLLQIKLKDGTVLNMDSTYQMNVLSMGDNSFPSVGDAAQLSKMIEGPKAAAFMEKFARNKASAVQREAELTQIRKSVPATGGTDPADLARACNGGTWYLVGGGHTSVKMRNSCGQEFWFHCILSDGPGLTQMHQQLVWKSGDACSGTLVLGPSTTGASQTYQISTPGPLSMSGNCITRDASGNNVAATITASVYPYGAYGYYDGYFYWSDGVYGGTRSVTAPGTYTVYWYYGGGGSNCYVWKSITVGRNSFAGTGAPVVSSVCNTSTAVISLRDLISNEDANGTWSRAAGTEGGTGGTFNAANGTFVPNNAATNSSFIYTVAGASGCAGDTTKVTINVTSCCQVTAASSATAINCANTSSTVTGTASSGSGNYSYAWTGPGGFTANTATFSTTVTGPYTLTVTDITANCTAQSTVTVTGSTVAPTPPQVTKVDPTCTGTLGSITVLSPSSSLTYAITGPGQTGTYGATTSWSGLASGTYTVKARNSDLCESAATSIALTGSATPADDIKGQSATCAFENVQFIADPATTGATYVWSATGNPVITGGTTSTTFVAQWAAPGVYTITMTATINGCSVTRTKNITVSNAVVANAGEDKTICLGGITRIGTPPPADVQVSYSWTPTTGLNDPTVAQPTASPVRTTTYTVTVTNPITGCVRTEDVTVTVDVSRNPRADAGPDQVFPNTPGSTLTLGTANTTNTPWTTNGQTFNLDYTWTGIGADVPADNLSDPWARITNFNVPAAPATIYTYVLDVRKIIPAGTENGNPIFQYCHAKDTVVLTRAGSISIKGNIWNNTNGNDLIETASPLNEKKTTRNQIIYAVLTNGAGVVIEAVPVDTATGAFAFINGTPNTNYTVLASNTQPTVGSTFLPTGITTPSNQWVYLGSQYGTGIAAQGTKGNGFVGFTTGTTNVEEVNIGFDRLPTPQGGAVPSQPNPGGSTSVPVTTSLFSGKDPEDAPVDRTIPQIVEDKIQFTTFPTNATSITINGVTYTATQWDALTTAQKTFTYASFTSVSVDPIDGAVTVEIPFKVIDRAGQISTTEDKVIVPFTVSAGITLSGNVWNDINGMNDNLVNNSALSQTPVQAIPPALRAFLVNSATGLIVKSTSVSSLNGTYTFNEVSPNTSYRIVLSNTTGFVGQAPPAPKLPQGWTNTGEKLGTTPGNDGIVNGILNVNMGTTSVINANFGIRIGNGGVIQ